MPTAKQVHPAKFPKFRVLYEDRYFTVAWGMYHTVLLIGYYYVATSNGNAGYVHDCP